MSVLAEPNRQVIFDRLTPTARARSASSRPSCRSTTAGGLLASEGAQGRGPRRRPAGQHAPALSGRSGGAGGPAQLPGPVLGAVAGGVRIHDGSSEESDDPGDWSRSGARSWCRSTRRAAFEVFTCADDRLVARGATIIGSAPIAEVIVEPREGGPLQYPRHEDGSAITSTGFTVVALRAATERWSQSRIRSAPKWQYDPALITTVEVRSWRRSPAPRRTRVTLEHRDLGRYGADAGHACATRSPSRARGTRTLAAYARGVREHADRGDRCLTGRSRAVG